jgi:hypothetical protein
MAQKLFTALYGWEVPLETCGDDEYNRSVPLPQFVEANDLDIANFLEAVDSLKALYPRCTAKEEEYFNLLKEQALLNG